MAIFMFLRCLSVTRGGVVRTVKFTVSKNLRANKAFLKNDFIHSEASRGHAAKEGASMRFYKVDYFRTICVVRSWQEEGPLYPPCPPGL